MKLLELLVPAIMLIIAKTEFVNSKIIKPRNIKS